MTASVIRDLRVREIRIPFTSVFRHASAERAVTSSIWVEAVSAGGGVGYGESCPRPYVTSETTESAASFIEAHRADLLGHVDDVDALRAWMSSHSDAIDRNPAAWCAVELAVLDALARDAGRTVDALLGLPPVRGPFRFSAILGDGPPDAFAAMAEQYRRRGFADFKIKLSGDYARDRAKVDVFRDRNVHGVRLRADANNLWSDADEAIAFLRDLECPLFAVEEPIAANRYAELAGIAGALDCRIVLDESLVRADQLAGLPGPAGRWIVNVRVSKMGGLMRSLDVVRRARAAGIGVIVGAQVGETSLLTRVALSVAAAAGPECVAQEGAFGTHLLRYDVCEPPLMFGAAGVLDAPPALLDGPGFGLDVLAGRLDAAT